MSAHGSKNVVLLALGANFGIAVAKFTAFVFTASSAMLAEAIHSLADTGNQLLLLLGMSRAAKPPDDRHEFGYKMESYFWSFVVAILLFSVGGLFALYEANHKFHEIHAAHAAGESTAMNNPSIAIGVLIVSIALEGYSWYAATKEVNQLRGEQGLWSFIESSKSTEIIVIWMEDTGALIGLLLALGGVGLVLVTGNPLWDVYSTASIGVLLIVIAFFVARETKSLLIGEPATPESIATIRRLAEETEGVARLINIRSMQLGEDEFLVAMKVHWDDGLDLKRVVANTNDLEARIRAAIPRARYIFVEADTFDPDKAGGAAPETPR